MCEWLSKFIIIVEYEVVLFTKIRHVLITSAFFTPAFTVNRGKVYDDAYTTMLNKTSLRSLKIQFIDRTGSPEPATGRGVVLEFMNIFMKEAFGPEKNLFKPSPHSNKLFPNEDVFRTVPNALEHYYLIGRLLGICILAGHQICVPISRFVIKEIFYQNNLHNVSDLAELDNDLFEQLMNLRDMDPMMVKDLELYFTYSVNEKSKKDEDLVEGGKDIRVTKENRLFYIEKVAKLKLNTGINKQLEAMRSGLETILPIHWLKLFNPTEVEFLLYGNDVDKIDTDDWEANTQLEGFTENDPTIQLFWKIIKTRFTQNDLAKLLQFTTSLFRPPLLGFKQLKPKFTISNTLAARPLTSAATQQNVPEMTDAEKRLPTAATCVNLLRLPPYTDEEGLYSKLKTAIDEVEGFAFN